jgi:hypothetical protein
VGKGMVSNRKLGLTFLLAFLAISSLTYLGAIRPTEAQGSWKFEITEVVTQDYYGNPKSTFVRGEIIMIKFKVTNTMTYTYAAEPFLALAKIMKGSVMWGAGAFSSSLLSGENLVVAVGIMIPLNAPTGQYKATVYVWSNWASQGGYPIAKDEEVDFTVI